MTDDVRDDGSDDRSEEAARPMCRGLNRSGARCRTFFGLSPDGYCFTHDPLRAVEYQAARAKQWRASGDRKRAHGDALPAGLPRAPKTLDDAVQWSSWAMHATATGVIDARTGHEIGYLVNAFKAAVEKRDLLREIEQLRAKLAELRKAPGQVRA